MVSRLRRAWGRAVDYVQHDLREIVAPSSLPTPPEMLAAERQQRWTLRRAWRVFYLGTKDYIDSWKPEPPDPKEAAAQESGKEASEGPAATEDLAAIGRGGADAIKPFLQELYRSRATMYRDAVQSFVEGYREGYAGFEAEEDGASLQQKPTFPSTTERKGQDAA